MKLNQQSHVPIYQQIAQMIEEEILNGRFQRDDKLYSQYQLAERLQINPATAAKGLNVLSEEKIAYDKRGLGKFVSANAVQIIQAKRRNIILNDLLEKLVTEAKILHISEDEMVAELKRRFRQDIGEAK